MVKKGVCCIVLSLEEQDPPLKFKTTTYRGFSQLEREPALLKLGEIIQHNLKVTEAAIRYCSERNLNYRLSSNIFPLITYDKAEIQLQDLPNFTDICLEIQKIKEAYEKSDVRLSCHPDQFNVLASDNQEAIDRTLKELNFYGNFMTQIGCPLSYAAPINIHVNNAQNQDWWNISEKFIVNFDKLSLDVKKRLVLENDDKSNCWSVDKLLKYINLPFAIPITFDYLHHKCHPDGLSEEKAFDIAYYTWGNLTPLFHYSETAPNQNNPRKHADYAQEEPNTYNKQLDVDYEFKMKEKSWK